MMLLFSNTRWMVLELIRQPSYIVSTLSFPALFYVIFALPESKTMESSNFLMGSFSSFAVFGVVFLQFGIGVAQERSKSWYLYLRTLPGSQSSMVFSRFLSSLIFSVLAASVVIIIGILFAKVSMPSNDWLKYFLALFIGCIVFCPLGLALGYWSTDRSAIPLGNLVYLPLSFAGGMWKPPDILPETLKEVSIYLPTRHYGELVWQAVDGKWAVQENYLYLLGYFIVFCGLAYWGYFRDKKQRFS